MTATDLRTLRDALSLTQEEFANELGVTVSTVNRWENGHGTPSRLASRMIQVYAERKGVKLGASS